MAVSRDLSLVTAMVDTKGTTLTMDYQGDQNGVATITVTGTTNGQDANTSFSVTVNPVDDAPVTANPIADVSVNEDAPDQVVALGNVFNDIDDANASITKSAASDNLGLVTVSVDGNEILHIGRQYVVTHVEKCHRFGQGQDVVIGPG